MGAAQPRVARFSASRAIRSNFLASEGNSSSDTFERIQSFTRLLSVFSLLSLLNDLIEFCFHLLISEHEVEVSRIFPIV